MGNLGEKCVQLSHDSLLEIYDWKAERKERGDFAMTLTEC
jgi:hypothetical protein